MLKNYIKITLRNLAKYKLYSFINVLSLSVGISACLLITLFVRDEITFDSFHKHADNIYRINGHYVRPSTGETMVFGNSSPAMADAFEEQVSDIAKVVRLNDGSVLVENNVDIPVRQQFLFADPSLFEVFDFKLKSGNLESFEQNVNSVFLSEALSIKYFGDADATGKELSILLGEQMVPLTVAGIVEDVPANSSIQFEMVVPFDKYRQLAEERRLTTWLDLHISSIVLLQGGAKASDVKSKINEVFKANIPEEDAEIFSIGLQRLKELHFSEVSGGNGVQDPGSASASWVLSAVGFFILLIACINFINLSLGMAMPRSREIGLRKVIGAGRMQILKQFIGESFLMSLLALVLAILLTDLLLPSFEQLTNKSFVLWSADNVFLALIACIALVTTTLISGVYPAAIVSRFSPVKSLKGKEKLGGSSWFSRSLIVIQFIVGIVFLTGTLVIQKQMNFIKAFDKGYDDKGLISINMPANNNEKLVARFKEKLQVHSFVRHMSGNTGSGWSTNLMHEDFSYEVNHDKVGYNFFKMLGVEVVEGRNFEEERPADKNSIIVNEAFVRKLGLENPVGQKVGFNYFETMQNPEIIGVVGDYNYESLHTTIQPMVYYVHSDRPLGQLFVKIDEQFTAEAVELITSTWRELVPRAPLTYDFVEDQNLQQYNTELRQAAVIRYSSVLAIVLSCMGLFGLASLHIRQRSKEIGLRKVLGANLIEVLMALSKHFVILVIIAFLVGAPLSWWFSVEWLESFTYKTSLPFWLFITSGFMMLILAMLSIAHQSIKTALVNPVESLRTE